MRVLITDGGERAALAAARSLVAAGHEVHVAAPHRPALAAVSRRVHAVGLAPDPLRDPAAYAHEVAARAAAIGAELLLPVSDPSTGALLEHREALPRRLALPLPDFPTYRLASNKLEMLTRASSAGPDVPETIVVRTPHEHPPLDELEIFPAVLKPHASVITNPSGPARHCKLGVVQVEDRRACQAGLDALPAAAYPVLLQRRIHGPGEGAFLLRWNGRILAAFAHRRLREKPPCGGVSVYRESIAADPDLIAPAARLLEHLDWRGVAMVECKRDRRTGRPVFMELNGRLWGSLQLAIDAGVDFPRLLVDCVRGVPVPPVPAYRVGVRSRWFWGDVDHLYLRLTRSPRSLHLDGDRTTRFQALGGFFRRAPWPNREREEVWRWRDPVPFLVETLSRFGLVRRRPARLAP